MPFQFTKSCSNPDISGRMDEWCVFIRYSQIRNVSVLGQPYTKTSSVYQDLQGFQKP